ncbi:lytic polysaccharide monooxygenase auxiliary activity family 9 protein [Streptomyces sp. NPDC048277]|uniref:lytic polysaccharide monooxygenase auxiliary activity family 9 protein n=1 Tax=Streptomyces sp. NPDC048277 TaxID=3155027 RepID=UPI00340640C4
MNEMQQNGATPAHGGTSNPPSRAYLHFDGGWPFTGLEAGKFFPATEKGLSDPEVPTDVVSGPKTPPPDGRIASGGHEPEAAVLDEVRDWPKVDLRSGAEIPVAWGYTMKHRTRRYNYFVTKPDWDPQAPLSRRQFEATPFAVHKPYGDTVYWEMPEAHDDPNLDGHTIRLPQRKGYHVILAVWEVADTGHAFYQVIDANFT